MLENFRERQQKNQPPCNVEIKLTASLLFNTVFSLSSISQSTSLIKHKIPGFKAPWSWNKNGLLLIRLFNSSIKSSTVTTSFSISTSNCFYFSNRSSRPPLKSTFTFIISLIIKYRIKFIYSH